MTYPERPLGRRIEIAPRADLRADPATYPWIEVTDDLYQTDPVVSKIGAEDEASETNSELTFTLRDMFGRYVSDNPESDLYPYFDVDCPVRFSTNTWDGTGWHVEHVAYVGSLEDEWISGTPHLKVTRVTAGGLFRRMGQGRTFETPAQRAILQAGPVAYWSCDTGTESTFIPSNLVGGVPLTVNGTVDFGSVEGWAGSPGRFPQFMGPDAYAGSLNAPLNITPTGLGYTIEFWFRIHRKTELNSTTAGVLRWETTGTFGSAPASSGNYIYGFEAIASHFSDGTEQFYVQANHPGGTTTFSTVTAGVARSMDGDWHHVRYCLAQTSGVLVTATLYYDGVLRDTDTNATFVVAGQPSAIHLGDYQTFDPAVAALLVPVDSIAVGEVAVYSTPTPAVTYTGGRGWVGEQVQDRISRIGTEEKIPVSVRGGAINANPYFEGITIDPWTNGGLAPGTVALSTVRAHDGQQSMTLTPSGAGQVQATSERCAVVQGLTYGVSAWVYSTATTQYQIGIDWYTSTPTFISTSNGQLVNVPAGVWTKLETLALSVPPGTATLGRIAIYSQAPHPAAGNVLWIDEARLLEPTGPLMGLQPVNRALEVFRDCETTGHGILTDHLGTVGYRMLADLYNQAPSLIVNGSDRELFLPFVPVRDDQKRRNSVTASRPGGASSPTYLDPSVDPLNPAYDSTKGVYDGQIDANISTDAPLIDHAAFVVGLGTVPGKRYPTVTLDLFRRPEMVGDWRQTILGDVVRISTPPLQHAKGDVDLMVRGWTQVWGADGRTWQVTLNTVRADPYRVWVVEGTNNGDRLEAAGNTTAATYYPTDTALSVATAAGYQLLTTTATYPADFPVDIDLAGEQVRVTAIVGAASPQALTVIRSINNVRKVIPIGTPVKLWQGRGVSL
jgi:hypothetical protein